jgi:hypothetical protein
MQMYFKSFQSSSIRRTPTARPLPTPRLVIPVGGIPQRRIVQFVLLEVIAIVIVIKGVPPPLLMMRRRRRRGVPTIIGTGASTDEDPFRA